jgi:hypothetical protein
MRNISFAIFAAAAAFVAYAASASADVPSGIEVAGCTRYELTDDYRVRQICDDLTVSQLRKDLADQTGRFEPKGDTGADSNSDSESAE